MRSLLPCPRGFFGVLRRDFAFCGTEKRGVRFFTHASRRKNLKREAARGGWIFTPCPRLRCPTFAPSRGGLSPLPALCSGLRSRSGRCGPARFGGLPPVPASGSAPVLRSAFPHFSERSRARCFAAVVPPRSFGARVSRATLLWTCAPGLRCYPARGVSMCIRRIPAPPVFGV